MKEHRSFAVILTSLLVILASAIATAQSDRPGEQKQGNPDRTNGVATGAPLDAFPGGAGSYWIYEGIVRYQTSDSTSAKEERVRWRMSIKRVLRRDGATAVILKGFPGDLDWSSGNVLAKESVFVRTDDGRFYRIESETGSLERKFADSRVGIQQFLSGGELWFQRPLTQGAQPGGGDCPGRSDQMYCWVLSPAHQVSLGSVKGATPTSQAGYLLEYRTNPDNIQVELVSGVGMVGYEYHHHGTVADTKLRLVEVHLAEEQ